MRPPRFYHSELRTGELELAAAEARHATGARRLRRGDSVLLFDGCGAEAPAVIVRCGRQTIVRVAEVRQMPRAALHELTIVVAPPRTARQDILVEKCTELGVAAIRPVRTVRGVAEVSGLRADRWRRIAIAAAKQSEQAWVPTIHDPADLDQVLAELAGTDLILLADPARAAGPLAYLVPIRPVGRRVAAIIGPEGGLTEEEYLAAIAAGAQSCRITPTVLRVETAAIAMAAVILSALPTDAVPCRGGGSDSRVS